MTSGVHVVFNLIVNTVGSFLGALALVYAVLATFRIRASRDRLALLLLPIIKVFWDLTRGIPTDSFFWEKLHGARQDLGLFQVGFGLTRFGVFLQAKLGARLGSHMYPQSVAELFDTLLSRKIGIWAPGALVAVCLVIAALRLAFRSWRWIRFGHQAARWRAGAELLATRKIGRRSVRIYAAPLYSAVPFAAGMMRPYVLLPASMLTTFEHATTQAVIEHELAHVAYADPLLLALLSLVSDLLWFLPGLSGLLGRVRAVLEHRADAGAVAAGADRTALASALVTIGEGLVEAPPSALGFFRDRLVLTERIRMLLEADTETSSPRWGYRHWLGKAFILTATVSAILQAVFFGNYH